MTDRTIIIIGIIWIASNIILPLLISSLDRLYKEHIDIAASKTFKFVAIVINILVQIFFIFFFLPALITRLLLIKIKNKKIQIFLKKTDLIDLPKMLFSKEFAVVKIFKYMLVV